MIKPDTIQGLLPRLAIRQKNITNCVLCDVIQRLYNGLRLLVPTYTIGRNMCTPIKTNITFHAPIFQKSMNSQHRYVQIPNIQYHPNQAMNAVKYGNKFDHVLCKVEYVYEDLSCIKLYPKRTKNVENKVKFHLRTYYGIAFITPILTKLTIAERHHTAIYTEFHPNPSRNVEISGRN